MKRTDFFKQAAEPVDDPNAPIQEGDIDLVESAMVELCFGGKHCNAWFRIRKHLRETGTK